MLRLLIAIVLLSALMTSGWSVGEVASAVLIWVFDHIQLAMK